MFPGSVLLKAPIYNQPYKYLPLFFPLPSLCPNRSVIGDRLSLTFLALITTLELSPQITDTAHFEETPLQIPKTRVLITPPGGEIDQHARETQRPRSLCK